jgi:hypothetical protein
MQVSLVTTFRNGNSRVQRLTATDAKDVRDHCVGIAQDNHNVVKVEATNLTGRPEFNFVVENDNA